MPVDRQGDVHKRYERLAQMRVSDFVPSLPPFRLRHDDSAIAQAREMVRHVRPRKLQLSSEHSRIARCTQQRQQDSRTGRIGHSSTEPVHDVESARNSQHAVTIQLSMYKPNLAGFDSPLSGPSALATYLDLCDLHPRNRRLTVIAPRLERHAIAASWRFPTSPDSVHSRAKGVLTAL